MRKSGSGLTHFFVALHNVDQRAAEGQSDHMILVLVKMVENHFIVPTARQELYETRFRDFFRLIAKTAILSGIAHSLKVSLLMSGSYKSGFPAARI